MLLWPILDAPRLAKPQISKIRGERINPVTTCFWLFTDVQDILLGCSHPQQWEGCQPPHTQGSISIQAPSTSQLPSLAVDTLDDILAQPPLLACTQR